MENKNKQFKPYDRVLVRGSSASPWDIELYSHYNKEKKRHETMFHYCDDDSNILPYEGNEGLVGTTDEPDEEVRLKKGEWVMVLDRIGIDPESWFLRRYDSVDNLIQAFNNAKASLVGWKYAIRFSDFNPNDMEETRKHILEVRNGKVIRYKG